MKTSKIACPGFLSTWQSYSQGKHLFISMFLNMAIFYLFISMKLESGTVTRRRNNKSTAHPNHFRWCLVPHLVSCADIMRVTFVQRVMENRSECLSVETGIF